MATEKNIAYDLSLFETAEKEESNVIKLPCKKKNHKKKYHAMNVVFTSFLMAIAFSVISTVIYGQIRLTELTDQINSMSKTLEESQSIYTQLQMKIESQLSLRTIEQYAKEDLDMKKTSPFQVEYVNLFEKDKAEFETNNHKLRILDKLKDIFSSLK